MYRVTYTHPILGLMVAYGDSYRGAFRLLRGMMGHFSGMSKGMERRPRLYQRGKTSYCSGCKLPATQWAEDYKTPLIGCIGHHANDCIVSQ